ncbi:MAG: hypothetical protein V3T77_03655 [Planctomycetota bacterium]
MLPQPDSLEILYLVTLLSFINGGTLSMLFACYPRLRQHWGARWITLIYLSACVVFYAGFLPTEDTARTTTYWFFLVAMSGYLPVASYILSALVATVLDATLPRAQAGRDFRRQASWRRRFLRATRFGFRKLLDAKLLEAKLAELHSRPTNTRLRRELIDLYMKVGDYEQALYHAYMHVELLPRGHSHGFALYRLCQMLVDRLGRLDAAQPYLRRILRTYPRSFFASYARRLINQYEAYADREV